MISIENTELMEGGGLVCTMVDEWLMYENNDKLLLRMYINFTLTYSKIHNS